MVAFADLIRGTGNNEVDGVIGDVDTVIDAFNVVLYGNNDPDDVLRTLSADFDVTFPKGMRKLISVRNQSGFTATLKVDGQAVAFDRTLANGSSALYFTNGRQIIEYTAGT